MKYRLIKYKNGSYGLHEMWGNTPYERPISVGDSVREIIDDIENMTLAAFKKPAKESRKYKNMREDI